ncbi:MAG TPA: N-acetyltransferase [Candidatus Lokiarchaeia archaeon]|nr:N-acetyltransferase [Candidatus Lokiarchaeia archaeon]
MGEDWCTIREATENDLFELELCCKEALDLLPNFKEDFSQDKFIVYLALVDNRVAGAVVGFADPIGTSKNLKPTAQIAAIFVNSSFRNQGIGKTLIEHFLGRMQERHFVTVRVEIYKTYSSGLKFFEAAGFKEIQAKRGKKILQYSIWDDFGIIDESLVEE